MANSHYARRIVKIDQHSVLAEFDRLVAGMDSVEAAAAVLAAAKADVVHSHSTATAGSNGFMSFTDKSKLDLIEAGATADQNAAEILASIEATGVADTDATLEGTWVNYGAGFRDAGYMRTPDSFVHLRGLIKDGALPSTGFTLPSGCRPAGGVVVRGETSGGGICQVRILSTGEVELLSGLAAWVSLEGISFYADGA